MTGDAWCARAEELGEFTLLHLPNRLDVYGRYYRLDKRTFDENGVEKRSWTAPAKKDRGTQGLDLHVLTRHYRGRSEGDVIGLHSTSPDNTSRWLSFDFDNHEGTDAKAAENLEHALALCAVLRVFGLVPLVEDSDGRGGLHVWVIFAEPAPTPLVHAFAVAAVAELEITAETYPKQPRLAAGRFGNWLRLPGRHHTRNHWSRFLADGVWHDGEDAVELWLCAWTSPSDQLPVPGVKPASTEVPQRPRLVPAASVTEAETRIRNYMEKLPTGLSAGEGRNGAGFRFACLLVRDYQLSDRDALGWLADWNKSHRTPMSDAKLAALVVEAHEYGSQPYGSAA